MLSHFIFLALATFAAQIEVKAPVQRRQELGEIPAYLVMDSGRANNVACTALPGGVYACLLYTSPSPRDKRQSRMPSSA